MYVFECMLVDGGCEGQWGRIFVGFSTRTHKFISVRDPNTKVNKHGKGTGNLSNCHTSICFGQKCPRIVALDQTKQYGSRSPSI